MFFVMSFCLFISAIPAHREQRLEHSLFTILNEDRAQRGLRPLEADPSLAQLARSHSHEMAVAGVLSHNLPSSGDLETRLNRAAYSRTVARENLARAGSVPEAETALIASPGHAKNLFAADVTRVGIGIVRKTDEDHGALYITQIFAKPVQIVSPAKVHTAFLGRVRELRGATGLKPLSSDPILDRLASRIVSDVQKPCTPGSDVLKRILAEAAGDLRRTGHGDISEVAVECQCVQQEEDLEIPGSLQRPRARVLGTAVRQARDGRNSPVIVFVALVGLGR